MRRRAASARLLGAAWVAAIGVPAVRGADAKIDLSTLDRRDFYDRLAPLARREGRLVLYNFAGGFDVVWRDGLAPRFAARYGVDVDCRNVWLDVALQQVVALSRAGRPSPADVFFAGAPDHFGLLGPALLPVRLSGLLPELEVVPPRYRETPLGIDAQGRWPLVHLNQIVLARDDARLREADVPNSFPALLAWAERHPGEFAFTSPLKGGSGAGFLYSAALAIVDDPGTRARLVDPRQGLADAERWADAAAGLAPLWHYMTRLLKAGEVTNGNADTLNLLGNGRVRLATAWEDQTLSFVRARLLPESVRVSALQGALVAGGDGLVALAHSRSPASALLFIDMAFGREFQTWKLEQHGSRSPRPDVVAAAVPAATARHLLPADEVQGRRTTANGVMTDALSRVLEERVISRL